MIPACIHSKHAFPCVLKPIVGRKSVRWGLQAGHYDCGAVHASVKQWDLGPCSPTMSSPRNLDNLPYYR